MNHPLEDNPTILYDFLLLGPLPAIYQAKLKTSHSGFQNYSNLLISKFAIQSASFAQLSKGIIELKATNEVVKATGYDLFTVNSVFRILLENYSTFNNIFVEPKSIEEQRFRFLLWKIDGLFDKQKMDINESDFEGVEALLKNDTKILAETINEFENCEFFKKLDKSEIEKIYKPNKKLFCWRFLINEKRILPLKIVDLIKHTCKIRALINMYKYSSIHAHSNYLALEHFDQRRGKVMSDDEINSNTLMAVYLTCLMIYDITLIDKNAKEEFEKLPILIKSYIERVRNSIKKASY